MQIIQGSHYPSSTVPIVTVAQCERSMKEKVAARAQSDCLICEALNIFITFKLSEILMQKKSF